MTLKEIAENHGLTPEGVDYALKQYQIVICEITHGMMSKLSYDAKDIIRVAQERWCDLKEQDPVKPNYDPYYQEWSCGNCGETIARAYNFCNYCGRKVKWE